MKHRKTTRNANRSGARALARVLPAREPQHGLRATEAAIAAIAALAALAAITLLAARPAGATTTELEADGYAYGFVSRVEGDALLLGADVDDAIDAEINHPLLTGDQINTGSGRIELVLPDGTVVRAAPGTVVVFDALAGAPDSEIEDGTFLSLDQGELQIRTPETFFEAEDLAIQTENATLYLQASGNYRITSQGSSYTEVVVRTGFAEASTRTGSEVARDGEALEISGNARPFVNRVQAGPADSLELWAGDLDQLASRARQPDVDPRLAYAASSLEGHGEWVASPSGRAWRPYVRADWRPFRYGRWVYTPSGLTWVASAPWGWVTSHYGFWDYVPGYGWLWLPGNVYSPAGVYWYWGPTHVAWVPYGYYNRYSRFGYGVYGWAGGDWGYWADWTFCPTRYFGRRGYDDYWNTGRDLERERRYAVPRGIVTTDTRGLGPDRWGKPSEALDTLIRRADSQGTGKGLPDVTDFVARRKAVDIVRPLGEPRLLDRTTSPRTRLAPLPEETTRDRFRNRTVVGTAGSPGTLGTPGNQDSARDARIRSIGEVRRPVGDDADRTGGGRFAGGGDSSDRRAVGGSTRDLAGAAGPGLRGRTDPPSSRVRSVGDRRVDLGGGSRSVRDLRGPVRDPSSLVGDRAVPSSPPARRVLDSIRAHRETARESSSSSSSNSGSVSKGSSSSDTKSPPRSSSSSAGSSGSRSQSVEKASPPPRSSNGASSGRSASRSRSRDNG